VFSMSKGKRTAKPQIARVVLPTHIVADNPKPNLLLTAPEFAKRVGMSEVWVRKAMGRRALTVVKVGKRAVRIPESEVDRIIHQQIIPAVSA
jgi:predicted DNA-binding transcriptional regulator AlpA